MASAGTPGPKNDEVAVRGDFEVGGVNRSIVVLDMTEKSIVKSMEEISTAEITAFTDKIEAVQGADILSLMASLFEFMGFDPLSIIKKLVVINKYYRVEKKLAEETEDVLKIDIMMMICANVMMGNLQMRSMDRRSVKGRAAIGYLVGKYQMKVGSTGAGLPSDVLTFPRVANSFPVLTCRTAQVLPAKDFRNSPFKSISVPKFMRVSAFASFCHESLNERTRIFLLEAVCAYSCDQQIVVFAGEAKKRKMKKEDSVLTPEAAYANQWEYILVSSTSPVPSIKMKKAMMAEFLIENLYGDLDDVVKNFRELLGDKTVIPSEKEFQDDIRAFISSA